MKRIIKIVLILPIILAQNSLANTFIYEKKEIEQITIREIMKNIYQFNDSEFEMTSNPQQILLKNPKILMTMKPIIEYENDESKLRYEAVLEMNEIVDGKQKQYQDCEKRVDSFTFSSEFNPPKFTLIRMDLQGTECTYKD